jgi:AcrR family transcriptional regulator
VPSRDARLTHERVVDVAASLADEQGLDAVTLSAVAGRLSVRTPSLYHHVQGLAGLRGALRLHGLELLSEALRDAASGRAERDALEAVAHAYLAFARTRPGLYSVTLAAAGEHDGERARASADRILATTFDVLRGYGLDGDDAVHAARFIRSALHGFAALEAAGGFDLPADRAVTVARMLEAIDRGVRTYVGREAPPACAARE